MPKTKKLNKIEEVCCGGPECTHEEGACCACQEGETCECGCHDDFCTECCGDDMDFLFDTPNSHKKCIVTTLGLVLLVSGIVGFSTWYFTKNSATKTVTVTGNASSRLSNQIAKFTANVTTQDPDKTTAVNSINDKSNAVVEAIKNFGIAKEDIRTANLSVYQMQESITQGGVQKVRLGDWSASLGVEVTVRDVSKASEFSTLLSSLAVSDLFGPNMSLDDRKVDDAGILSDAVADATRKATALAVKSGRKLGGVISISEAGSYGAIPMYDKAYGMGIGGGGQLPMEPGTTETNRSVVVVFSLK